MNLFIQIDVRIAILPRLSRPRWYIIVIFCGNLRNMPSRNTGKNNKNILWLLGSQILGNKTNCDQMTQKSPASASAAPIVGVFSARWLAVCPGHTPAPGPRADINGGVSPVVTTPWAYLQIADNAHGRCGLKNSWGEICLIAFFARPIFALDHFWHLIYFDFDLLIVWWPNQKRPWNTAAQHTALESIGGTCCQECLECYARCSRDQGRGPALPPRNNSGHAGMFTFNLKHTNNLKLVKKLSPNYF